MPFTLPRYHYAVSSNKSLHGHQYSYVSYITDLTKHICTENVLYFPPDIIFLKEWKAAYKG